jgi:hypothetical protein
LTIKHLQKATSIPQFRDYLKSLAESLKKCIGGEQLSNKQRSDLKTFFAVVGETIISEAANSRPVIGEFEDPEQPADAERLGA